MASGADLYSDEYRDDDGDPDSADNDETDALTHEGSEFGCFQSSWPGCMILLARNSMRYNETKTAR